MAEPRITFVTGKGGVGKSTVAAAIALSQCRTRSGSLLVEVEDGRAAVRALGNAEGVRVITLTHKAAMEDAVARLLRARILAKAVVKQRSIARLLDTVPAIRELVVLEAVRAIAEEHPHAAVVVDLPATGHAVDFLRVPSKAKRFLQRGPAARMCDEILEQVLAHNKSRIVVVSTFEPVVAQETKELCGRLAEELGFPAAWIVMNRAPTPVPAEWTEALALRVPTQPALATVQASVLARNAACAEAADSLQLLSSFAPVVTVPEFYRDPAASEIAAEPAHASTTPRRQEPSA